MKNTMKWLDRLTKLFIGLGGLGILGIISNVSKTPDELKPYVIGTAIIFIILAYVAGHIWLETLTGIAKRAYKEEMQKLVADIALDASKLLKKKGITVTDENGKDVE